MPDELIELQDDVEALYAGPLDRFVEQRRQLQGRAKQDFPGIAPQIGSLRKPTLTAAAINQLRARDRSIFDEVVSSGFELREAIGRGDPSQALADRQSAIRRALEAIEAAWGDGGPTLAQRQRMANTLQAISVGVDESVEPVDERTESVVAALRGRLTADLEPPGLEVLMGLQPGRRPQRAEKKPAKASNLSGSAVATRGGATGTAKAEADAAEGRRRQARAKQLQQEIEESRERGRALDAEMEAARTKVLELQDLLEGARSRRADLRRELDAEVARRRKLETELRSL